MGKKKGTLSPSAMAYLVLMAKAKGKTPLEVIREFNYEVSLKKNGSVRNDKHEQK